MPTQIEWTDETWNPVRGCSLKSKGCEKCYAMKQAHRFSGPGGTYEGLTELGPNGPRWTGKIALVPEKLDEPLRWRKPRKIFVNSMSDLFHEDVPFEFIRRVFDVCGSAQRHTFQILTKRPGRMLAFARWLASGDDISSAEWPRNVWLGCSAEDQETADERIPLLLQTPAAIRFVSYEPALGPVDFQRFMQCPRGGALVGTDRPEVCPNRPDIGTCCQCDNERMSNEGLNWIIAGSESGPKSRPAELDWYRGVRDQCQAAGVAFFFKQHTINGKTVSLPELDGRQWAEFPEVCRG